MKELNYNTPSVFDDIEKWETSRRSFLRSALIAGALSQISLFTSCSTQLEKSNDVFTAEQTNNLKDIINIFFPDDGNGPSAQDINAFGYILWVMHDSLNRKAEENEYVKQGLGMANDTALIVFEKPFIDLSQIQKEALISKFMDWPKLKSWSSMLISLILEALLLDPLYGGNTNEVGWKWLNHTAGYPRPTEELRYERIMEKQMKIVKTPA